MTSVVGVAGSFLAIAREDAFQMCREFVDSTKNGQIPQLHRMWSVAIGSSLREQAPWGRKLATNSVDAAVKNNYKQCSPDPSPNGSPS